ncbi:D-amino acid dehydrogenase small subunit [Candidatus Burkholderia verschuerenii]|uniref:D-amino acid dehydrogenase small subunit n=1 Tax=Candidatus Burkholderia verschuerenii TaxID=242163 RepID=A0A0L0MAL6_9BURK|nr:D-amino acid dehydrogenase small subunit [Candidatus Burkholderia verschuerenii]
MDVIVIGGGIAGIATAYQLHAAGHGVCVVERHATVAQGATYGQGGALLPSALDVWFGPTFMASNRAKQCGMLVKPGFDSAARDFLRQLGTLREPEAFAAQYARLQPLIELSRRAVDEIETGLELEFEQRRGMLHLFRQTREMDEAQPALDLLKRFSVPHRVLSPEQCIAAEPSVPDTPAFAGGVLLPDERTANCPLFTKQLKQMLDDGGVQFRMNRVVAGLRLDSARAAVELIDPYDEKGRANLEVMSADAIVVAAGVETPGLIAGVKTTSSLYPMRMHTLTAPVAYEERAPHLTVVDSVKRITMTRVNQRLRIAGAGVFLSAAKADKPLDATLSRRALDLLGQGTHDWIPGAARVSAARAWDALRLLSADGLPVVGATRHPRLYVNAAHGPAGWGLACGSAKVIADLVSGATPDVPADTLAAVSIDRF